MNAVKISSGPPAPHFCFSELPAAGDRGLGAEQGSIWMCSCNKFYQVKPDLLGTGIWVEVQDKDGTPIERTVWQQFKDWWQ